MASAQVLPNSSRKQEHLEAGKRRLEEFRKKKAAERAKKSSSSNQLHDASISPIEKQPLDVECVRITYADGVGTSDRSGGAVVEHSSGVVNIDNVAVEYANNSQLGFLTDTRAGPASSVNDYNALSVDSLQTLVKNLEFTRHDNSELSVPDDVQYTKQTKAKNDKFSVYTGTQAGSTNEIVSGQSVAIHSQATQDADSSSSQSSYYRMGEAPSKENDSSFKDFSVLTNYSSHVPVTNVSSNNSGSLLPISKPDYASSLAGGNASFFYEDLIRPTASVTESAYQVGQSMHDGNENGSMNSDMWAKHLSSSAGNFPAVHSAALKTSDSLSSGFGLEFSGSYNHVPMYSSPAETNTRRSRSTFLDSLGVSRASTVSPFPVTEPHKPLSFMSSNSKVHNTEIATQEPFSETTSNGPYDIEHSMNSSVLASDGVDQMGQGVSYFGMERKHEFRSPKQDEDFAALEQHIEDLTQEKFSLQRALEASRTLAESLAAENSALTDSYNQQGSVVNQLKADLETLQEEIKAQLVELESVKIGYENAQLECNAADERAKLLASEVIGLEEKALKLRSSELKLERHLEHSQAEITSCKKKMSSQERERQDFLSTIDALQEEKKLLQSKLRKVSASGKSIDLSRTSNKKDVSTSTEGLDSTQNTSNLEMHNLLSLHASDASTLPLLSENEQFNIDSVDIPPDQIRMIQNIHELISELSLEKDELMKALAAESSHNSKLKESNKELSRKLESQTQRLELLTAQSMASENVPARQSDFHNIENTTYADEGDEVVERVLGWIMKLFPGGPSRRRTSKLL